MPTIRWRSTCGNRCGCCGNCTRWGSWRVNVTCGSPYYNPHIQRPALFPPSDGYPPPEDPLVGVHRLIQAARQCHAAVPQPADGRHRLHVFAGFLPHVAQAVVRAGWIDAVGIGRMLLSYPELAGGLLGQRRPAAQENLPHLQRLHDGPAAGPGLGLLSAGCLLQVAAGGGRVETDQGDSVRITPTDGAT